MMMNELMNVTGQKMGQWRVRYYKGAEEHSLTLETLQRLIPTNAREYKKRYGIEDLDKLKAAAGVKVDTKAPKNDFTESLRAAAGII